MLKTLFLHVGMHKTGTSAIQDALVRFDEGDIAYAGFRERNHSVPIYTAFSSDPLSYRVWSSRGSSASEVSKLRQKYLEKFDVELSRKGRSGLIVVGEDIGKIDSEGKLDLIRFASRRGWKIKVFFYVRSPRSFAASALQQRIKSGLAEVPQIFYPNYRNRVEPFLKALGADAISVRNYDKLRADGKDVVEDFCSQIGISIKRGLEKRSNESLSLDALRLVFALNRSNACSTGDPVLMTARQRFIAQIADLYPGTERLGPRIFGGRVCDLDLQFLSDHFDVNFTLDNEADRPESNDELEKVLFALGDVDLRPLVDLVKGSTVEEPNPYWLVNRLYLSCVTAVESSLIAPIEGLKLVARNTASRVRRTLTMR